MKKLLFVICVFTCNLVLYGQDTLSAESLKNHVKLLASDEFMGRGAGSTG